MRSHQNCRIGFRYEAETTPRSTTVAGAVFPQSRHGVPTVRGDSHSEHPRTMTCRTSADAMASVLASLMSSSVLGAVHRDLLHHQRSGDHSVLSPSESVSLLARSNEHELPRGR